MERKEKAHRCVVPWRNPEQFCKVYKHLYSNSISNKRWAVDQISVWETRCYPALATAVEATVGLVAASIQDLLFQAEKTFCQDRDIQMLYSMAIVRFVNLIVEIDQTGFNKIRMSVLADKRNIPAWILNLRHEATHSYCPSLPVLRMGAERALQYLEDTFWKIEAKNIRHIAYIPSNDKEKFHQLITQYRNLQFCRLENTDEKDILRQDQRKVLENIRSNLKNGRLENKFLETLVQPGVFICAEDLVRLLHDTDVVFLENNDDLFLPKKLESFWLPLIRLLHGHNLIPKFLELLLLGQETCNIPICHKAAVAWAMQILLATSVHAPESPLSNCFKGKGALFDLHRLLYACLKGANKFTLHIFNMIVNKLKHKERYTELFLTFALYQGLLIKGDPQPSTSSDLKRSFASKRPDIVFSLDDAEEDFKEEKARSKRLKGNENVWSLAPVSLKFADLPLGAVINPAVAEKCDANESRTDMDVEPEEEKFIIFNKSDIEETVEEKVTLDKHTFPRTCLPEGIDMIYRKR